MKKLIYTLVVICIACICAAEISDSHRDAAKELYIIKSPRDVFIKNFMIVFKTQLEQMSKMGIDGAKITKIEKDTDAKNRLVYDPTHPDAILSGAKKGYVEFPNINTVNEMVDMISATRAYEANVAMVNGSKSMFLKALEIGR